MAFKKYTPKRKFIRKRPKRVFKRKNPVTRTRPTSILGRGFPDKIMSTHKFFYSSTLTNATGTPSTIATEEFGVNALFQPVISGTTHQPLYFDQLISLYTYYCVVGAKIKVTFNGNTTINNGAIVCLFQNDTSGTLSPTLMSTMVEQNPGRFKLIGSGNVENYTMTMTWSAKKRFGGSVLSNTNLRGTIAANPTLTPTFVIALQDIAATTTETCGYAVEIEYITMWTNKRDIAGS